MNELNFLKPETAVFSDTGGGFLSLSHDKKNYERVSFYLMFPFKMKEEYISVRESTVDAEEIGIIRTLADFGEETAGKIQDQLKLRYFMPKISELKSMKNHSGYTYFTARSDKGDCKFTVQNQSGNILRSEDAIILTDIDGNRFEINQATEMPRAVERLLDLFT